MNNFDKKHLAIQNSAFNAFLRLFALPASLICVWILFKIRNVSSLNKCLLAMSFSDALYTLSFLIGHAIFSVCTEDDPVKCGKILYLGFLVNYITISEFLSSCLAFFNILMETFLMIQRIMIVRNNFSSFKNLKGNFICSTVCIISILIYFPVLFAKLIEPVRYTSTSSLNKTIADAYEFRKTKFGGSFLFTCYINTVTLARVLLATIILLALDILLIIYMSMRSRLLNDQKKIRNYKSIKLLFFCRKYNR